MAVYSTQAEDAGGMTFTLSPRRDLQSRGTSSAARRALSPATARGRGGIAVPRNPQSDSFWRDVNELNRNKKTFVIQATLPAAYSNRQHLNTAEE
ncbi:hypothetical protein AAFF_G00417440 [Aldrovandia affinis]|uniref:Uncharacterized protein n=1 Tax=Aldrovandia affinis TaxID=143900 RepID=A0AAD7SA51_9TELE|nr:hypothetical protein AAFF_G00417440 [Aldrovandia affinis]